MRNDLIAIVNNGVVTSALIDPGFFDGRGKFMGTEDLVFAYNGVPFGFIYLIYSFIYFNFHVLIIPYFQTIKAH